MKEEDVKKDKPKKPSPPASAAAAAPVVRKEEDFPSLSTPKPKPSVPVTSESKSKPGTESSSSKTTLADRCALSDHKSVQHGALNDFPTLSDSCPKPTVSTGASRSEKSQSFLKAFKPSRQEEDFPELPTSTKTSAQAKSMWIKPTTQKEQTNNNKRKVNTPTKVKYSDNDFPSLGGPINSSVAGTWMNKKNTKNSKKENRPRSADTEDYSGGDIRDRFSPVNVPESDKSDKTKNKKKKKKAIVNDIKEDKRTELRGNSSLDGIASLLMATCENGEKDVRQHSKSKPEEKVSKKKEDKVEKRLESSKVAPKVEVKKVEVKNVEVKKVEVKNVEVKRVEKVCEEDRPASKKEFSLAEEFPSLGPSQSKKPPPGFMRSPAGSKPPPPGLSKAPNSSNPPPGFIAHSAKVEKEALNEKPSLPMSSDLTNFQYTQPDNFPERNKTLIETIQLMCSTDTKKFTDFKTLSGEFRRSEVPASLYYTKCESILGKTIFHQIFSELLALLPDIDKQQELLSVYLSTLKTEEKVKSAGKYKDSKGAWTPSTSGFLTCQICRQVLQRKDYNVHATSHNLDTDFPSLDQGLSAAPVPQYTNSSWVRAK